MSYIEIVFDKVATANRSRVNTRGRSCKKVPLVSCSLITIQNLVVDSHTVCMHVGGSKQYGGWWTVAWLTA